MMVLAMYSTVLGLMVPEIQTAFSFTLAQVGVLSTLQSVGMVVSLILCFSVFSAFNAIKGIGNRRCCVFRAYDMAWV